MSHNYGVFCRSKNGIKRKVFPILVGDLFDRQEDGREEEVAIREAGRQGHCEARECRGLLFGAVQGCSFV